MALIPEIGDPTLEAVDAAIAAEQSPRTSRNIGFGDIGHECSRYLWYKINSTEPEVFDAATLRIFRNGHNDESAMADDLRRVPGISLYTHDPNRENKQYKFDALEGRFTGRLDGVIVGLKQAPKTPHLWECKAVNDKKFDDLCKDHDLKRWNMVYYAQMQSGMYHAGLDRGYMTVCTPGLRRVTSLRVELDKEYAESLVQKAKRVIEAAEPPERIGAEDFYICRYCRFHGVCHGN